MKAKLGFKRTSMSQQGRWTKQEHMLFVQALQLYGKHWKLVEKHVGNRSSAQLRSHAQKFFNRLERELQIPINKLKSHDIKEFFKRKLPEFRSYKNFKMHKFTEPTLERLPVPNHHKGSDNCEHGISKEHHCTLLHIEEQYALQVMELQELLHQRFLLLTLINNLFHQPCLFNYQPMEWQQQCDKISECRQQCNNISECQQLNTEFQARHKESNLTTDLREDDQIPEKRIKRI